MADVHPPQQWRKFSGLLPNPVVYEAARIFSAGLPGLLTFAAPWYHACKPNTSLVGCRSFGL